MSLLREKTMVLPASAGNSSFHSSHLKEGLECFHTSCKKFLVTRGSRYRFPWCVEIQDVSNNPRLTIDFSEAVHLRDGLMMKLVAPTIRNGGVDCVYVVSHSYDQLFENVPCSIFAFRDRMLN